MKAPSVIPLIIDGKPVVCPVATQYKANVCQPRHSAAASQLVQGADKMQCIAAVESCARAFPAWASLSPKIKRSYFLKLSELLRARGFEIRTLIEDEISCPPLWSLINLEDTIALVDELAALCTSERLGGSIPLSTEPAQPLVFMEPLGVVLGIAPWNAPLILGLRSVAAAVAAGNTAVLKGSELSPRTHYLIANLFQEAGFPAGVVNFITNRTEDAAECFDTLINHNAVRKCNFTGSTAVGRAIAAKAGAALKPVLLELGGKNFAVVLKDADLDKASRMILEGAFLNNGQICMSTDTVLVVESVASKLSAKISELLPEIAKDVSHVINDKSRARLQSLLADAEAKSAKILRAEGQDTSFPPTVVESLTPNMDLIHLESFGPLLGIRTVSDEEEALQLMNESTYGLSAAIFSENHFRALQLGRRMKVGAVHINGSTVHDASNLPHGGHGDSGFGRFGAHWGLLEFVHTKTIIINA
ncbi:putative aldehyde dehydrogenase [Cadophora sp. MPI-SDFR-AT-0126]|nr:putative aldehyde dehydrogenase [Leotiomycetes sp. MPI-SDFR-AT-0126]